MSDGAAASVRIEAPSRIMNRLAGLLRHGDVALALAVVSILVVLILPLPGWLLDVALAFSLAFSVMILMTALFVERPLDFNAFPVVLLLATMIRLALNMASTRLILANGHNGTAAAGHVIESFGGFVAGGNFVIGLIVFSILVIVNFVVITKGSTRIAEVAARFTLDAMPGKQMAIDADLSAGLLDEAEARVRRQALEEESNFYGAMDGASKFVRGDAVAGLLITGINIVGGMVIGIAQMGLPFTVAADSYTRLTIGDGLVSQIPALIVSTAAGLIVTKGSVSGTTERALVGQLLGNPKVLAVSAFLLAALAVVPGVPALPFLALAAVTGAIAWRRHGAIARTDEAQAKADAAAEAAPAEDEPISAALHMDEVRLELGYGLLSLVNSAEAGPRVPEQIRALRRQLAGELGFVMPSVRIQDNMQLAAEDYVIRIREIEAGRGSVRPGRILVMDPRGDAITLPGEAAREPTFGLPAMWIDQTRREEAAFRGYTVVDAATVVTTHLTEVIKDNMAEMLSYAETRKLLEELDKEHQKLIGEIIPTNISYGGVQRVLQNLLAERISIRDLATILEAIAEIGSHTRGIGLITEHVRSRLARQISDMHANAAGVVPLIALSAEWEQTFAEALVGSGDDRQLALPPSKLQAFVSALRNSVERQAMTGESAVLLTSPQVRPFVRSIVSRFRPSVSVISQSEVHPRARIKTVGHI
ncbi:MAG: flagellar biosynthesis protein FlhA [Rhodospirillales bacterium]|nr:flagellar biosynthesis protein FlhA [Rhodospirillales bacterium]